MLSGCWSENQGEHSISHVSLLTCMHLCTFLHIEDCHQSALFSVLASCGAAPVHPWHWYVTDANRRSFVVQPYTITKQQKALPYAKLANDLP